MLTPEAYKQDLDPKHKGALEVVIKAMEASKSIHQVYVDRWREAYKLHRNHTAIRNYVRTAGNERDRDRRAGEAADYWKAELCIPLIFSAIETIVPRAVTRIPTHTVLPLDIDSVPKTEKISEYLQQTKRNISYDRKLAPTARRGFKYGLGVQKTYWERKTRDVTRRKKGILGRDKAVETKIVTYDGPQVEDVDIGDFFWDPAAKDVESARWLVHRTWRDIRYVKGQLESGDWFPESSPSEQADLLEMIAKSSTGGMDETSLWGDSLDSEGISGKDTRAGRDHEILEYHDGEYVYTIVNRQFVAICEETPFWHKSLPFQIFRPTIQEGEFVGISEIEPIKHLQYELNTLRSQRRDNAAFVIDRVTAYMEGMVDPDVLKRGPGAHIPTIGDPREVIFQLPVEDLPQSSYREEDALKADFDRATGIDESSAGAGAAGDTATGIQLVQGAANVRIAYKTRNLLTEVDRPAMWQFHELAQQHLSKPTPLRIDDSRSPIGYRFEEITPDDLMANVEIIPDDGSSEPENKTQEVNDALALFNQLNGNTNIDQRALAQYLLIKNGVTDTDALMADEQPGVGDALMAVAQKLSEMPGVDGQRIEEFMAPLLQQFAPPEAGQDAGQNGGPPQGPPQEPAPAAA
jgi:hypothetical protein